MSGARTELLCAVVLALALALCAAADLGSPVVRIAESIPVGVDLATPLSTYEAWLAVVNGAQSTLDIACMYFTLTGGLQLPPSYGGHMGAEVYAAIERAAQRGVHVRVVMQAPGTQWHDVDAFALQSKGLAEVRPVDFAALTPGDHGGVLHTKFMVADSKTVYSGSANIDWRALSQVKELGVLVNSTVFGADYQKIFEAYWLAAATNSTPAHFPESVSTKYSMASPMQLDLENGHVAEVFSAVSPPQFAAPGVAGRTDDLAALVATINGAQDYLDIEVMDYFPASIYMNPKSLNYYWPAIDGAIRNASFRGVQVRFLAGIWNHTLPTMWQYLYSLNELENVSVRKILIPGDAISVPFTRVNHAKYCTTEDTAYIGTSNWTADYYTDTGGVSVNLRSTYIAQDMRFRFERDWFSKYASEL